ncbi:MAG: hypothetical protein M1286_03560 [Candidatus Marsarchaeota archaeon]|nr:hypothetical protein [Candidatus Marsarchaeota archaeon]
MQTKERIGARSLDKMGSSELRAVGERLMNEADERAKKELLTLLAGKTPRKFKTVKTSVETELCIIETEPGHTIQIPSRLVYELERDGKAEIREDGGPYLEAT